jgi:hypothetical protein
MVCRCRVVSLQFKNKARTIMKISKIKFYAISLGWSYGGSMNVEIKASAGSKISISWGDGRNITHIFNSEYEKRFDHDYFPRHIIPPISGARFLVEISVDTPNCRIIDFYLNNGDMATIELDVANCPELEALNCRFGHQWHDPSRSLDLSNNTALKYLYCSGNKFTSLDLSNNTALEELHCKSNKLLHLSLASNVALKKLDCSFNNMEQLFIYYAPQLIEVDFEDGNSIDTATKAQIYELIADNKGRIIRAFDDDGNYIF